MFWSSPRRAIQPRRNDLASLARPVPSTLGQGRLPRPFQRGLLRRGQRCAAQRCTKSRMYQPTFPRMMWAYCVTYTNITQASEQDRTSHKRMSRTIRAFCTGLMAIVGGIGYLLIVPQFSQASDARVRNLTPVSAAAVRAEHPGSPVLIEGIIGMENESRYRSMVAYRRSSPMRGPDGQTLWIDDEHIAPSLLIMVNGDMVRVEEGYRLLHTQRGWQTKLYHYAGFERGDAVLVAGTVTAHGTIRADFVASGTRQSYLMRRLGETWSVYIGGVCAIVLGGFLVVGALMTSRARSRAWQSVPA